MTTDADLIRASRTDAGLSGSCTTAMPSGCTEWRCYLGRAAVDQQIIGPDFLGEYAPSPGVG